MCVVKQAGRQTGSPVPLQLSLNHVSIDFVQIECPFIHNAFPLLTDTDAAEDMLK